MHNRLALESLIQRGKTPLYKDLTSLYQETQDALRGDPGASAVTINLGLKHIDFDKKLKNITKKHMGVVLEKIFIFESSEPNMMSIAFVTKEYWKNLKKGNKTSGMMIEEIHRLYDDRKGQFDPTAKFESQFTFMLQIHTAWWSVRNTDKSFYFTAEELAAITIHELGHTDHYIRTFFRESTQIVDASDIVDYIKANPHDKEVVLELLKVIRASRYLDKSWLKVVDVVEKYFQTSNSFDDPYYWEALSSLSVIVSADRANRSLSDHNFNNNYNARVKTQSSDVDAERSADEFASRNGAYDALTSVLLKFEKIQTSDNYLLLKQFMYSGPAALFGSLSSFLQLFLLNAETVSSGYDPLIRRMSLIVETAKHAFHDAQLAPEIRQQIKQQIDTSEAYIKQYEDSTHHKVRSTIKTWKDNVGKFGRIVVLPLRNQMSKDYERLQNANRSLSRHSLYYLADK